MCDFIRTELDNGCHKKEYDDGTIRYYDIDVDYHRLDGPSLIYPDGNWNWRYHGDYHRWNGPARYWNGKYDYFIMGTEYSKEQYYKIMLVELWKWLNNE